MKIKLLKNVKYSGVVYTAGDVATVDDDFLVIGGFAEEIKEIPVIQAVEEKKEEEKKIEPSPSIPQPSPIVVEPTISTMPPIVEASQPPISEPVVQQVVEPQIVEDESKKKEVLENTEANSTPLSPPVEDAGVSAKSTQPEGDVAPTTVPQADNSKLNDILSKLKGY